MCLADLYRTREPLPGIVTFPALSGIQDVMGFRIEQGREDRRIEHGRRDSQKESAALVCSAGVWESTLSSWCVRSLEREYCRVVQGRIRLADRHGRSWEFAAGSAFLLLRGFEGKLEVLDPVQIVYVVFTLPDYGALDWCMTSEGRTALGQVRHID